MAMDPSRLTTNLTADYYAQLQALFSSSGLQGSEITAFNSAQQKIAQALANAGGPDIVTEVRQADVTSTVTVTSVSGVASGSSVSGPGAGTAIGTPN